MKLCGSVRSPGGQNCLSRKGVCRDKRAGLPLGETGGENISTYLLRILELDIEPTWLDHCLTSCPWKKKTILLRESSVPAPFPPVTGFPRTAGISIRWEVEGGREKKRNEEVGGEEKKRKRQALSRCSSKCVPFCPPLMQNAILPSKRVLSECLALRFSVGLAAWQENSSNGLQLHSSQMAHVSKARRLASDLAASQDHDLPQWDE